MVCTKCNQEVTPVVTSVGGGSCSVGRRDKFYCPTCGKKLATKGCFIASATYEGADAYEVSILRQYRDDVLTRSWPGKAFVRFYYRTSPMVAAVVERSPILKSILRKVLDKLVEHIEG